MKAAGIERFGGDVRELSLPDPRPAGAGEALITVRAAGVAPWDDLVRLGSWEVGLRPPMALGVAASGTVAAVGPGVDGWSVGDEVMTHPVPLLEEGCWSELLLARGDVLAAKPSAVSWEDAAAFPVPALTADQALAAAIGDSHAGRLLVHGAGGVTGQLIAALAVVIGAEVAATAGPRSVERLRQLGVAEVFDYHDDGWPAGVREWAGGTGVPAAVNAAPGGEADALSAVANLHRWDLPARRGRGGAQDGRRRGRWCCGRAARLSPDGIVTTFACDRGAAGRRATRQRGFSLSCSSSRSNDDVFQTLSSSSWLPTE